MKRTLYLKDKYVILVNVTLQRNKFMQTFEDALLSIFEDIGYINHKSLYLLSIKKLLNMLLAKYRISSKISRGLFSFFDFFLCLFSKNVPYISF